ncbi:MAG: FAD binding domain-containing protein [Gaiellaceae bacterium]
MIPADFEYAVPDSLGDALNLLRGTEEEAKPLAGGQSLLPLMKLRLAAPALLVDLRRIPDLRGIERSNGDFSIGALTRHAEVASMPELGIAARAAGVIADQQVRNRGTIGGTMAHGDPAADLPTVLLATEGSVLVRDRFRERQVEAADLFLGYLTTALQPGQVITRVVVPVLEGYGFHYEKFTRRAEDWAIVGVVALVAVRDQMCEDVRIGLTNMGSTPLRAFAVEEALRGQRLDADSIARASEHAADETEPPEDLSASADYKRHLARVLTRRALECALETAGPQPQIRPARLHERSQLAASSSGAGTAGTGGSGEQTLEQSFDVDAPMDRVWSAFTAVEPVVPCLPGAELTDSSGGVFRGNFRVKVGPASASYRGTVKLESVDDASRTLVMKASGQDRRGQGSASATITVKLNAQGDAKTHVETRSSFTITGTLARFGRSGMIEDVASLLMSQFATCIGQRLAGKEVSAQPSVLSAGSMMLSLLKARARRLLARFRKS